MDYLDLAAALSASGTISLPGSKSISNRVLLLAALAEGQTEIRALLESDDTRVMRTALQQLGVVMQERDAETLLVTGCAGVFPVREANLFLGNAGTAFRPLTAALTLASSLNDGGVARHYVLDGVARMRERPIADLVDALHGLGAAIRYQENVGYPPLEMTSARLRLDQPIRVRGDVSSQFLTALLMALPLAGQAVTVEVIGELISKPYIEITIDLMRRFGVTVQREAWQRFTLAAGQRYRSPGIVRVEGDASSASYFLAAGAIGGGPVRVEGVGRQSIQGDVRFVEALKAMGAQIDMGDEWIEARAPVQGALRAFDADFNHIPDAAMTLAVLALFADGPCTLRNIASWRVKETDRIAAMAKELRKVGALVEEGADYLRVTPPSDARLWPNAVIDTYDDHRMAMCFSLVALAGVPIRINEPACVGKTFPDYFSALARIVR